MSYSYSWLLAIKQSAIPIAVCTVLDSWWWTEKLSETFRVLIQKLISVISASRWFYYKNRFGYSQFLFCFLSSQKKPQPLKLCFGVEDRKKLERLVPHCGRGTAGVSVFVRKFLTDRAELEEALSWWINQLCSRQISGHFFRTAFHKNRKRVI